MPPDFVDDRVEGSGVLQRAREGRFVRVFQKRAVHPVPVPEVGHRIA